jgi:predicted nucleic acid-binding protein
VLCAVLDANACKYIAAAVEGRAAFLVTGDPHLLALSEYGGVRVVSPRAFLDLLAI